MKKIFFLIPILMGFASILGMEEKWVQLGDPIDLPDHQDPVWRVQDGVLELNLKAKDPETGKTFEQLQEAALKKHIPYILLGLYESDEDATFVDGSYLSKLYNKPWKDSKYTTKAVEIFVAGDDGIFTNLVETTNDEENFKDNLKKIGIITAKEEVNPNLQEPGYGQLIIANILKEIVDLNQDALKKFNDIQAEIASLKQEKDKAANERIIEIENKIKELEKQKANLLDSEGIPTEQTRQWFEWAVQYLPKDISEQKEAKKELDEINIKLGKVVPPQEPEKPKEDPQVTQKILLQHLQNLTRSFEQLAAQLT